jgi:hypothetical protein
MYVVTGQILTHDGDWHGSVSVPTFYLDSRVQGILTAEAARIVARGIVNPLGTIAVQDIDLSVCEVPSEPMSGEYDIDGQPIPRSAFAGNVGHVGFAKPAGRHARTA